MEIVQLLVSGTLCNERHVPIQEDAVLQCLGLCVSLDNDCTLRSFFAMLRNYPLLAGVNPFLPGAAKQAADCPSSGCSTPDMTDLAVSRVVELTGAPGEPSMTVYTILRGRREPGGHGETELRFHPLKVLLDMPLRLGKLRHAVFGDRTSILECGTVFTLFEILEGIAWELGFQGGSQQCSLRR